MNIGSLTLASVKFCPSSGKGCYALYLDQVKDAEVEESRLLQILDEAAHMGCQNLSLSGGEVTASKHNLNRTLNLMKHARSVGINKIVLITTGYRLDEHIDKFIGAGVDHIQISIDGLEDFNDSYKRSEGATKRAFNAINACREKGVHFSTNSVVSHSNLDLMPNSYNNLLMLE